MTIEVIERMMTYLLYKSKMKSFRISLLDEIILRHHFKRYGLNFSAGMKKIIAEYMIRNCLTHDYDSLRSLAKHTFDLRVTDCEHEIIRTYRKLEKEKNIKDILGIIPPQINNNELN